MNILEENILIENKKFQLLFSFDYQDNKLFIDLYDKKTKTTTIQNHEITNQLLQIKILDNINHPSGTTFKLGKTKYLVRNHDKIIHHDNKDIHFTYKDISEQSIFDTRNINLTTKNKVTLLLKEAWLKI